MNQQSPIVQILAKRQMIEKQHPGYVENALGHLVKRENFRKPETLLKDDLVLGLFGRACELQRDIRQFVADTHEQIAEYMGKAAVEHGVKFSGTKGNFQLVSPDGLMKINVDMGAILRVNENIELARTQVENCIRRWGADSNPNLVSLAAQAFSADSATGNVSQSKLAMLTSLEPADADPEWESAVKLIKDSIEVVGKKRFVRLYYRLDQHEAWIPLSLSTSEPVKE
jgi:hypothetical protein